MRNYRLATALSAAALMAAAGSVSAQDAAPAPQATPAPAAAPAPAPAQAAGQFSDEQLKQFDGAYSKIRTLSESLNGAQPTAEQQAQMAAAIQESGLTVESFNAISTAVSTDPVLPARIAVLTAPQPAAGSVAAGVTDAELTQFVTAMGQIRTVTDAVAGGQPTPEQSAQMTAAVEGSGLEVERFNAIATAVSSDASLQARAELIGVQQSSGGAQ